MVCKLDILTTTSVQTNPHNFPRFQDTQKCTLLVTLSVPSHAADDAHQRFIQVAENVGAVVDPFVVGGTGGEQGAVEILDIPRTGR